MCLIAIHAPGDGLSDQQVKNAYLHNPDGFGVAVVRKDRIDIVKSLPASPAACLADYRAACDAANGDLTAYIVAHWRYATHGPTTLDNAHPFRVPGSDAVIAHNGILPGYGDRIRSDTRAWVEDELPGLEPHTSVNASVFAESRVAVCFPGAPPKLYGAWVQMKPGVQVSNTYSLFAPWSRWSSCFSLAAEEEEIAPVDLIECLEEAESFMDFMEPHQVVASMAAMWGEEYRPHLEGLAEDVMWERSHKKVGVR